jgi:hypothetical protein
VLPLRNTSRSLALGAALLRRPLSTFLLFLPLNFVLYWGIWNLGYYRDDYLWARMARDIAETPRALFAPEPTNAEAVLRVTQRVSMALTWTGGPSQATTYHLVGLLLHTVASTLLFALLVRLRHQLAFSFDTRFSVVPPLVAALFFDTSRGHAMAVLWISSQSTLLATCAILLLMLVLTRKISALPEPKSLILLCLLYIVALCSKNTTVVFPLVCAAYAFLIGGRSTGGRPPRRFALCGLLAAFAVLQVLVIKPLANGVDPFASIGSGAAGNNMALSWNVLRNLAGTLLGVFIPSRLYALTPLSHIPYVLVALVILAALVAFFLRHAEVRGLGMFGLAWILSFGMPAALQRLEHYSPLQFTSTRYYYEPLVGAAIVILALVVWLMEHSRRSTARVVLVAGILVHLGIHVPFLRADMAGLRAWGAEKDALIQSTLARAVDLPPKSVIYAVHWGLSNDDIDQIDRLFFRDTSQTLEGEDAYVRARSNPSGGPPLPRFVAWFDDQRHLTFYSMKPGEGGAVSPRPE